MRMRIDGLTNFRKRLVLVLLLGSAFLNVNASQYYVSTTGDDKKDTIDSGSYKSAVNTVSGTNYYVSTSGKDSNNGKSLSSPFKTLNKAESVMVAGDVCNVADGTYTQTCIITINTDGASTSWTVFKSTNKWGAKIIIPASAGDYVFGFHTQDSKYIQIEGFEISVPSKNGTGITASGDKYSHHHIRTYNNYIYDCGAAGIQFQQGDYYDIQWNVVHHCAFKSQWQPSGIGIYENRKSDSKPGFHNIIANNISYSNENKTPRTDGAFTDGNGIIIDDLNCSQQEPKIAYDQQTLVENNLCYDNGGRGVYVMSSQFVTLRNNTAYKNSRKLGSGELVCHDASNLKWVNNIGYAGDYAERAVYAIADEGAWGNNSNIKWVNNLTYNGTVGKQSVSLTKTTTTKIDATNKLGVDPMFVNPVMDGTGDFRLKAASPAKDSGTSAYGLAYLDLDNTARVQDGVVDLGSYETAGVTIALTGISLNLASASMAIHGFVQLKASLVPADASYRAVEWISSNESIATVTPEGLVTGVALGSSTITANSNDSSLTAVCEITVTNDASVNVTQVKINAATSTLEVGASKQLEATVEPSFASNIVLWTTDNPTVATVSTNGLIKGVTAGKATVTATSEDGKITATNVVTVKDVAVTGVVINLTTATLSVGATKQLTETIAPANAKNKIVTWKSSNNNVATVSSKGLVTGVAAGKATISVTTQDGNKTANCSVTVTSGKTAFYEAEDGTFGGGAALQNSGNASGGKLIGALNNEGAFTQISKVDGGKGGNLSLTVRYANGYADNRSLSLYVNGVWVKQLVFKTTGGWNSFAEITTDVPLISGTGNTIRLQRDATDVAAADIDKYTVLDDVTSYQSTVDLERKFIIFPNPVTNGSFKVNFNGIDSNFTISIIDLQGKLMYRTAIERETEIAISTANILNPGMYFVSVQRATEFAVQKLIVL